MGYNFGKEKKKIINKLRADVKMYKLLGMSPKEIASIAKYDYSLFKGERIYRMHNQSIPNNVFGDNEIYASQLYRKFINEFSYEIEEQTEQMDLMNWLENKKLFYYLDSLTDKQLMIIKKVYLEGYLQNEIAQELGVSAAYISRILKKIRRAER